jgi:hypothetical protein
MNDTHSSGTPLTFVTCVSDVEVFRRHLLASPCIAQGRRPVQAFFNARSAAQAFNSAMDSASEGTWLVWVHQDVLLPDDWDTVFLQCLANSRKQFPRMAVAGVYGLSGNGQSARRAGHVLDRGTLLREPAALPCAVDSLDELLFAVQKGHGLKLDPALGFDFYATDVVLQAQALGLQSLAVDAYCEHWSSTPTGPVIPSSLARRISNSGAVFEAKWAHRLPVQTSWLTVGQPGDVDRFLAQFEKR